MTSKLTNPNAKHSSASWSISRKEQLKLTWNSRTGQELTGCGTRKPNAISNGAVSRDALEGRSRKDLPGLIRAHKSSSSPRNDSAFVQTFNPRPALPTALGLLYIYHGPYLLYPLALSLPFSRSRLDCGRSRPGSPEHMYASLRSGLLVHYIPHFNEKVTCYP
ncbi:hypothetical protein CRG98_037089 [Punica granatum]|uniref:Uncharacterized protein n=1 Tax=Punica granatum TaxID=22663 RepID=A0A2I0IFL7_PUNGR|nr:hypothetical protein CRG98_037089 [Punica granatum]